MATLEVRFSYFSRIAGIKQLTFLFTVLTLFHIPLRPFAVEVDIMQPIDPERSPKVRIDSIVAIRHAMLRETCINSVQGALPYSFLRLTR